MPGQKSFVASHVKLWPPTEQYKSFEVNWFLDLREVEREDNELRMIFRLGWVGVGQSSFGKREDQTSARLHAAGVSVDVGK